MLNNNDLKNNNNTSHPASLPEGEGSNEANRIPEGEGSKVIMQSRSNVSALERRALIMNIQDLSFQDGPGIRTTIFFKGCPLKCQWCSNPEGQNFYPELMHNEVICNKSYECKKVCPYDAIKINNEKFPEFDRTKCKVCETKDCVDACNYSALKIAGEYYSVDELINKVLPNIPFYVNSGGGITLSGGEPLAQPEFVKVFIQKSSEYKLTVGVETCGYFNWNEVEEFIDKFEFIYFDLKCIDDESYLEFTGSNEKIILDNLTKLSKIDSSKIIITIPVIPEISDSADMMNKVIEICTKLGIQKIRLLPYHSFGKGKYNDLGRGYNFQITRDLNPADLLQMRLVAEKAGITCWIE